MPALVFCAHGQNLRFFPQGSSWYMTSKTTEQVTCTRYGMEYILNVFANLPKELYWFPAWSFGDRGKGNLFQVAAIKTGSNVKSPSTCSEKIFVT